MTRKLIITGLIVYFAATAALILVIAHARGRGDVGPAQPIDFSHPIHINTVGLECDHCHKHADRSQHPGIPAVAVCMECHESAATDRPEVRKLRRHWDRGEPIEWVRVHRLPWHAYFTHQWHVRAGVECAHCHAQVEVQARVRKVRSLKMGWCVSCHRSRDVSVDCWVCHK